jgi:SNF family Na+-dependent transporter
VFYQTGVGMGTLYCVACLNPRRQDLLKGVIYVPIGLIVCGFFSAITIFVYLSHFCKSMGLSINDPNINLSGPELSFNVLPKALVMLPMANLWIFVFFVTMVFLGIDSQFGMI